MRPPIAARPEDTAAGDSQARPRRPPARAGSPASESAPASVASVPARGLPGSTSGGELAANADRDKPQVRNLPETVTVTTVTEPENGCVSAGARAWVAVTG